MVVRWPGTLAQRTAPSGTGTMSTAMSDERTTDDDQGTGGPRREADETSSADAGLTGVVGVGAAQPAAAHDDEDENE